MKRKAIRGHGLYVRCRAEKPYARADNGYQVNGRVLVRFLPTLHKEIDAMNNSIIWWVGFIVILLAILSFLGLR